MATNSSSPSETSRKRHNISMADDVRSRAEILAGVEKRSVSNLFEVLVDREWDRLVKEGKIQAEHPKEQAA